MKKNTLLALASALICGLVTFSACSKDDDYDGPATESVFLSHVEMVTVMPTTGDTLSYSTSNNTWEAGLLKKQNTEGTIKVAGLKSQINIGHLFTYSGKNCIEIRTTDGNTVNTFTYDANGRITSATKKAMNAANTVYTQVFQIKAYTNDGFIQQMEETYTIEDDTRKVSYDLTWKNGDLVKYTVHKIEPAGEDVTYEVQYDTYPSIYTGYPMAHSIFEGPIGLCYRCSSHNPVSLGESYKYKNGRVVRSVNGNTTAKYSYTDGTKE